MTQHLDIAHAAYVRMPTSQAEAALYREAARAARVLVRRVPASERADAIQDALCAFVLAVRQFDGRGRFGGYAARRMQWAIANGLRERDVLTRDHRRDLESGALPRPHSVALSHTDVMREHAADEAPDAIVIASDDEWEDCERRMDRERLLPRLLATLKPRTRSMTWQRLSGMTLLQIGKAHGLTEARAAQITKSALVDMRRHFSGTQHMTPARITHVRGDAFRVGLDKNIQCRSL